MMFMIFIEFYYLFIYFLEDFVFLICLCWYGILVGLFYWDVYWKFLFYGEGVLKVK